MTLWFIRMKINVLSLFQKLEKNPKQEIWLMICIHKFVTSTNPTISAPRFEYLLLVLRWIWNLGPFAKCGFWVCKETYQHNNHSASNLEIHPNLASWFSFNLFAHANPQTNICIGRKEACNEIIIAWVSNLERVLTIVPLPRFQSAIPDRQLDVIVCKMQDIMIELLLILQNGSEVE